MLNKETWIYRLILMVCIIGKWLRSSVFVITSSMTYVFDRDLD